MVDGMNITDVLLINLPIQKYFQKDMNAHNDFNPSLGLLSIIAYLELNGISCSIMDLTHENISKDVFEERLLSEQPKIIGITAYTENINMAIKFSERVKKLLPESKIILGGPHISLSLDEFKKSRFSDFAVQGEGESIFLELYYAIISEQELISYDKIDGLAYKQNNNIMVNKQRAFITDLDLLPIVCREVYPGEFYKKNETINIYTSKGCPSRCIYCAASALSGSSYRVRDIEHVFLEILSCQHRYKVNSYFMVDDSFTVIKKRILQFVSLYNENNANFSWICESLANSMTEELLEKLATNGCIAIQYGLESANQEVQSKIHKFVDLNHAIEIIRLTSEKGIMPCASFIFGHYCDTLETMKETADLIKFLHTNYDMEIGAGYNTPFPGTYQYLHKDELGLNIATQNFDNFSLLAPVVETENFTLDDQRNFMYEIKDAIFRKGREAYASKINRR